MINIFCVAKPFLKFLSFCGLFTSLFEGHPCKGRFVFKAYTVVLFFLNLSCLLIFPWMPFKFGRRSVLSSDILATAWEILSNSEVLTYILSLIYQLHRQSYIRKFLSSINEFDGQVWNVLLLSISFKKYFQAKLIGIHQNWKRHKCGLRVIVFVAFVCFVSKISVFPILQLYLKRSTVPLLMTIRLYYFEFFRMVYIVQFILASSALQVRFRKFNKNLEIMKFDIGGKEATSLAQLYHKLCDTAEILNETFTFHFIAIFANLLVRMTNNLNFESFAYFFISWQLFSDFTASFWRFPGLQLLQSKKRHRISSARSTVGFSWQRLYGLAVVWRLKHPERP